VDESGLIARAVRGDVGAFNGLVEIYQGLAYNVALRTVGDPDAAADATQDAFLSAFNAIDRFRGGSFKSWLLRIVTNSCFDAGRRIQRRPASSLDELMEQPGGDDLAVDPGPLPEVEALRAELVEQVQAALLLLPFDQRTAIVLADLQGLSYDEVASVTGASLGTVKSRINRGRLRLRDALADTKEPGAVGRRP
jgi:RNA polymerase sigma-70 factor (ECF subfamily)